MSNSSTVLIDRLRNNYDYQKKKIQSAYRITLGSGENEIVFRSMFEFNIAILLDYLQIEYEYEDPQGHMLYVKSAKWNKNFEKFGLTRDDMANVHHLYMPDFFLPDNVFLEVKGHFSQEDRAKMLRVVKQNKDKRIIMVLQSPQARATSKLLSWEWCEKHEIEWCSIKNLKETLTDLYN